jgi:hypothetical protein
LVAFFSDTSRNAVTERVVARASKTIVMAYSAAVATGTKSGESVEA